MPTFLLTHHFPANFQTSPETMAAARDWFARLGATVPRPGNPAVDGGAAVRLGDCGTDAERRVAYTLISTEELEAAMAVAKAWPLLARGGGVEVRELPILTPSVLDKTSA
jgi:hypothetical protein